MTEYKRLEGESDEALIFRVAKDKDVNNLTWQQVADILNPLLGTDYGESTFRKKYTAFTQMFNANKEMFTNSDKVLESLREEERRLEIEKVKFRDERNAWSQQNRIQARAEAKLDYIQDALLDLGRVQFPEHSRPNVNSEGRTLLIMLSDLHIGATFDNYWGRYNSDIAKDRLGQLLDDVKVIARRHGADQCRLCLGGDLISSNIHKNLQVTNRENVIDQIKIASELISSFAYELTNIFDFVQMVSVAGNHSRIDRKEEQIHEERLDDLISFIVSNTLKHVDNFHYDESANIDNGIALFSIEDKFYLLTHGDFDSFTERGVQNLITMVRVIPYAVLQGHRHFCAVNECNQIKMVQSGSLSGCGDQFTREMRLRGKPSQMVCVCSEDGIESYYPVELE